jgi:beta-glucosidase
MRDGLAYAAAHHLNLAHGAAVRALREVLPSSAQVGVTLNVHQAEPATDTDADVAATRHADDVANQIFLEPMLRGRYPETLLSTTRHLTDWSFVRPGDVEACHEPLDLLGVNYYHPVRIGAEGRSAWPGTDRARVVEPPGPRTVMGWPIEASGLTRLLVRLHEDYRLPLVVTENGTSGHDVVGLDGAAHDPHRVAFLRDHVQAVADALSAGADVRGYYVWSFLDNFEWAWGYEKRFGIVHVDYGTQVRTPKDSALWYRDLIARGGAAVEEPGVGAGTA